MTGRHGLAGQNVTDRRVRPRGVVAQRLSVAHLGYTGSPRRNVKTPRGTSQLPTVVA